LKSKNSKPQEGGNDDTQKPLTELSPEAMAVLSDITRGFKATFNSIKDHPKL
jgi:hypothetical protein